MWGWVLTSCALAAGCARFAGYVECLKCVWCLECVWGVCGVWVGVVGEPVLRHSSQDDFLVGLERSGGILKILPVLRHSSQDDFLVGLQLSGGILKREPVCVTAARTTSLSAFSSLATYANAYPLSVTAAGTTSLSAFSSAEACARLLPFCVTAVRTTSLLVCLQLSGGIMEIAALTVTSMGNAAATINATTAPVRATATPSRAVAVLIRVIAWCMATTGTTRAIRDATPRNAVVHGASGVRALRVAVEALRPVRFIYQRLLPMGGGRRARTKKAPQLPDRVARLNAPPRLLGQQTPPRSFGTVSLVSTSPSYCADSSDCSYNCAQGYFISEVTATGSITLTSTYSSDDCACYTGTGTVSGTTFSGSFGGGAASSSGSGSGHSIAVCTTVEAIRCTGTYTVESDTVFDINAAIDEEDWTIGTISLQSVSPGSCEVSSDCNYKCATGYYVYEQPDTDEFVLASTYTGSSCACYSGVESGSGSGSSFSGWFAG